MDPELGDPCVPRLTARCFREQPERAKRLLAIKLLTLFTRAVRSYRLPAIAPMFLTVASIMPPPAPAPEPPPIKGWSEKSTPGWTARWKATAAATVDGLVYMGTGDGGSRVKDWWEYDPDADTWTQKTDFGGTGRTDAVAAAAGGMVYVGTGWTTERVKDWWGYDPSADAWIQKTDFGGTARQDVVAAAVGGKVYMGSGWEGVKIKDWWRYSP